MNPAPRIHTYGLLRVSLATEAISTLIDYVFLPVNVEGIQALVKAWVVDNQMYDLLLGVLWMRRIRFNPDYPTGRHTLQVGSDAGLLSIAPSRECFRMIAIKICFRVCKKYISSLLFCRLVADRGI